MATTILNGTLLGTAFPGQDAASPLKAVQFTPSGKKYTGQVIGEAPLRYVIRGAEILKDINVAKGYSSRLTSITETDLDALEMSGGDGLGTPSSFTTPDGWVRRTSADGTPYIELIPTSADANADGIKDGSDDPGRSANLIEQGWEWVKANPAMTIGGLVLIYFLFFHKKQGGRKGKKGLLATLF